MSWRKYLRRAQRDRDFQMELEAHLAHEVDLQRAAGKSPEAARAAALRKVGNLTRHREEVHEMNTLAMVESIGKDLAFAARQLRRNPGFAAVAVLSLALGIGANTAIFQLLNAVRLRPLPIPNAHELVVFRQEPDVRSGRFTGRHPLMSYPAFEQLRDKREAFSTVFAFGGTRFNLAETGEIRYVEGLWVSGNFFEALGVNPAAGRFLTAEDDRRGCTNPGAVIGHALWQRDFSGDRSAIGRDLAVGAQKFTVIGVAPASFFGVEVGRRFDIALPFCASDLFTAGGPSWLDNKGHFWLAVMARMKPGWTVERANAQLRTVSAPVMEATLPQHYKADAVRKHLSGRIEGGPAGSGVSTLRRDYERPLVLLLSVSGLVLLIACANLANLLLARASAREREFAVRRAIGASRGRVIRQLMVESVLLASTGALAGVAIASQASRFLVTFLSTPVDPIVLDLAPDVRVLGFAAALAVATCLLFGLAPAIRGSRASSGLHAGRGLTSGRERFTFRRALVAVQVALSVVLVAGALLFVRSLVNLARVDAGFQTSGVIQVNVFLPSSRFPVERRQPYHRSLLDTLRAIPGVTGAALSAVTPLSGSFRNSNIRATASDGYQIANFNTVSEGYFRVMGIGLTAGRDFNRHDTRSSADVAIVNELVARLYGGDNPIGRTVRVESGGAEPDRLYQVVGVVRNAKRSDLRENFALEVYVPASQEEDPGLTARFVVHTRGPSGPILAAIRREVDQARAGVRFAILDELVEQSLTRDRLMATLSGLFAALAAVLAVVGLYGVVSYMVERRRREIGIRVALGADRRGVVRMILGGVARLLLAGIAAGVALTLPAARVARSLLYGIEPHDPGTLALTAALLSAAALAASWIPARRASAIDPSETLRSE